MITSINDRTSSRIGILKSLKYKLNRKSLKIIYIAYIRSILEYGDVVWDGNLTSDQSLQLERIQYECARVITGLLLVRVRESNYRSAKILPVE